MFMPMNRRLTMILFLFAQASLLSASDKTKATDLLEQANAKSNLRELPSFEMKASVKIENKGQQLEGSYMLLWNGPNQWREELSLPGYTEVQVGGKGVVATERNLDFTPLRISQLRNVLRYGRGLLPSPNEKVKGIERRLGNGVKIDCVEIAGYGNFIREVCVNPSSGVVVRPAPFADRDLMPIGAKMFPRYLSQVDHGQTLAEVNVTELKVADSFPASAFDPPAGAVSKPGCTLPVTGRLVKKANPEYPPQERMARHEGAVTIYAVIGEDGALHGLQIISGANPALNQAALDAVKYWRYEPYTCNGVPVEVESEINVNFSLAR
jgi:TonB family protein